jgi:predicted RND superfamily exporter protein
VLISVIGISQIKATGNITGDLPTDDQITRDVNYLQDQFGGSVPFDVLLDTKKENSFYNRFEEIEAAQAYLATYSSFSKSLSIADAIKLANMSFSNGDPTKFELPSDAKLRMIGKYVENSVGGADGTNGFLDSTRKITRITAQMRDLGSYEIKNLLDSIRPDFVDIINPDKKYNDSLLAIITNKEGADKDGVLTILYDHSPAVLNDLTKSYAAGNKELEEKFMNDDALIYTYHDQPGFNDSLSNAISMNEWNVIFTGTAIVASYGTLYLVNNLLTSLLIAIGVIGLLMALLFRSWRMVLVSLIPNFLPLIVTAGVMGFTGIPIKPSTLLVFSIAFGISVDDTIHFLAKFRQELKLHEHDLKRCILVALRETGGSMIYTSIVLFFGFLTFSFSQFGGTKALGVLISLTLLVAMLANLVILPSLLLYMEKKISNKALAEPLFQLYDEEEDIEFDDLSISSGEKPDEDAN